MLVDLLSHHQRRPASASRAGLLRPAALFAAAAYLLVAAAPAVRLLVHEHAGDDRPHAHSTSPHSHGPTAPAVEARAHPAEHSQPAADDGHDHHHGHHHDDPHHEHGHGEAPPTSDQPIGDVLRADDDNHRAHWHEEAPHGLVIVELPLLVVPLDGQAAAPSSISSAGPRDAARSTRARGPPLRRSALDTLEI